MTSRAVFWSSSGHHLVIGCSPPNFSTSKVTTRWSLQKTAVFKTVDIFTPFLAGCRDFSADSRQRFRSTFRWLTVSFQVSVLCHWTRCNGVSLQLLQPPVHLQSNACFNVALLQLVVLQCRNYYSRPQQFYIHYNCDTPITY